MKDRQDLLLFIRESNQSVRLRTGGGKWLLDNNYGKYQHRSKLKRRFEHFTVFPCQQRFLDEFAMQMRAYDDKLNISVSKEVV